MLYSINRLNNPNWFQSQFFGNGDKNFDLGNKLLETGKYYKIKESH